MIYLDQFFKFIDHRSARDEVRLKYTISEVETNRFYLPFKGDDRKHFELNIELEGRWIDEVEHEWELLNEDIQFYMTSYAKPTIKEFSKHIIREIKSCIEAMEIEMFAEHDENLLRTWDDRLFDVNYEEIQPHQVYKFMKLLHKNYEETQDFLRDLEHYQTRLYHSMKWAWSMAVGKNYMFSRTFEANIGTKAFLTFIYQDEMDHESIEEFMQAEQEEN